MLRRVIAFSIVGLLVGGSLWFFSNHDSRDSSDDFSPIDAEFSITDRPQSDRYLFDYAGLLSHFEEGAHKFLDQISRQYSIEALIVTLPNLQGGSGINSLAVDIVNGWQIGQDHEGRGLLLLLIEKGHLVRLEVNYQLEDVFTDAFAGFIEDKQLKPYFANNDLGTGLVAVIEELQQRAQLKYQGEYTPGQVARMDQGLLTGGAGAKRNLSRNKPEPNTQRRDTRPRTGAATADLAWRTLLTKWAGQGKDIDLDVYTQISKMEMGDPDRPDPRTQKSLAHWRNSKYRVLQDADHAVIFFDNRKGWENAPFLFCRTVQGWKFDIVHQRRLVVMGSAPNWFVEQGRYPYIDLLRGVSQSIGKDLPLLREDLYRCDDDLEIAKRIGELEKIHQQEPNDITVVLELLHLNVITGRRPNHIRPLVKLGKRLAPGQPKPFKYNAIFHVHAFFQYQSARKEIVSYLNLGGEKVFAFNFLGFVNYQLRDYRAAKEAFEEVLSLVPDNLYALSYMARVNGRLYINGAREGSIREDYKRKATEFLMRAKNLSASEPARVARLERWLRRRDIIPKGV